MQTRLLLLAMAVAAGCGESAGDVADGMHPYSGGDVCVSYPDLGYRVFPYDSTLGTRVWPRCALHCSPAQAAAGAGTAPLDQALPAGPCDDDGATCQSPLMAGWSPPCKTAGGPGNGYVCTCRRHAWHCALTSQGGALGEPPTCLTDDTSCRSTTWTATEVCACGRCSRLCTTDADCTTGRCQRDALCVPTTSPCAGPDECTTKCVGYCR